MMGRAALLLASTLLLASACNSTQLIPGPLWVAGEPGEGASSEPLVGSVIRHSGPVWVQRPGMPTGSSISYYDKRVRVQPGARIRVGYAGRAEFLWPNSSSSIVLFDSGEAEFGALARDEPLLSLRTVSRARIVLEEGDRVLLPGGAELQGGVVRERGGAVGPSGPFLLEKSRKGELLRIKNHSKEICRVLFREEVLELIGGEEIDLPIELPSRISSANPVLTPFQQGDFRYLGTESLRGQLEGGGLRMRADDAGEISLNGLVVRLQAGEEVFFSSLAPPQVIPDPDPDSNPASTTGVAPTDR